MTTPLRESEDWHESIETLADLFYDNTNLSGDKCLRLARLVLEHLDNEE